MSLTHALTTASFQGLGYAVRLMPRSMQQATGRSMGRLMMVGKRRLQITRDNVSRAFPEYSDDEKGALVRGAYENLGVTLAELMVVPSLTPETLLEQVKLTGLDQVRERAASGKPSVLVSGHYGNWEWMAMAAGLVIQHPLTIVTHPQRNTQLNNLLNSYRTRFGNNLVPMHDAARSLVRTIHGGGVVAFLADQHASIDRDPWISFFGRETPTYAAPAAISLKLNAPMYFGVADRQEDGSYHVNVQRIASDDLGTDEASIIELTRRHVQALETVVRNKPHLWSWQHRRWRQPKPLTTFAHDENRHAGPTQTSPVDDR